MTPPFFTRAGTVYANGSRPVPMTLEDCQHTAEVLQDEITAHSRAGRAFPHGMDAARRLACLTLCIASAERMEAR